MTASEKQQAMLRMLDDQLSSEAVDLSDEGSAEYAFPVACARDVFDSLERAGRARVGGRSVDRKRDRVFIGS